MLTKTLRFDDDVLSAIRAMQWSADGCVGKLVAQLDRKLYERVNKALSAMGGTWNRKAGGHVFPADPRPAVEGLLENGALTVERDGFFETPRAVVERMLELVNPTGNVLEPSAGLGAIADYLPVQKENVFCIEKNEQRAAALREKGYVVHCGDFLEYAPEYSAGLFDTIFMNPPFEEMQDVGHVERAYRLLRDGGAMVAVMSESPFFSAYAKADRFRRWLAAVGGYSEQLPAGSFKESGTSVNARLVVIRKEI